MGDIHRPALLDEQQPQLTHDSTPLLYDGGVPAGAAERIEALLTGESLVIQKRTKRKALADVDIRPMLLRLQPIAEEAGCLRLLADTAAQTR